MKRTLALLLALALCIGLLAGCAKDDPADGPDENPGAVDPAQPDPGKDPGKDPVTPAEPYVYKWTRGSEETTMNPHGASTTNDSDVIEYFQGCLYHYRPKEDGSGVVILPELAASAPTSSDGLVWEIKISPDAKWSTGEKITAEEIEWSYKMQLDPLLVWQTGSLICQDAITIKNANEYWSQGTAGTVKWEDVGIKAIDSETLQITATFTVTADDVMRHFYRSYTAPVYKANYEKAISADGTTCSYGTTLDDLVFSGPFVITTWNKTAEIIGKKNEQYILADMIHIDELISRVVTDESTRLEMFETGQSDSVSLGTNGMAKYGEDPRVMSYVAQSIETLEANMNHPKKPWLQDPIFRKAIFYAINRDAISKLTNNEAAGFFLSSIDKVYADGTMYHDLPEVQAMYEKYAPNSGFDEELAKKYMDEAAKKYNVTTFEVDILYTEGNASRRQASEYIQSELHRIFGDKIKVTLSANTYNQINNTMRTSVQGPVESWDLAWSAWGVTGERITPWKKLERYTTWHTRRYTNYQNTVLDDLVEQCKLDENRLDEKKLTAVTIEAEKSMFEDMTCIPVYGPQYFVMYNERVDLPLAKYTNEIGWGWLYSTLK